ncbi:hypothetical protein FRC02_004392 [Tulasnella sp. 418]|nr:hypothetical protein FRC02_004392 [Tulasnella sp. 418]
MGKVQERLSELDELRRYKISVVTMFFGKVFSTAVLGFTALAGIATASVVPAPAFDIEPRAEVVNSTQAGLDIATKFQANVYGVLPKLVDYDRAGLDTTPVFEALFKYYDETAKAISSLPPVKATTKTPDPTSQKTIDIANETLNSVNAVVNILNPTDVNAKNAQTLAEKTSRLLPIWIIVIPTPWGPILIIIPIRRLIIKY